MMAFQHAFRQDLHALQGRIYSTGITVEDCLLHHFDLAFFAGLRYVNICGAFLVTSNFLVWLPQPLSIYKKRRIYFIHIIPIHIIISENRDY